jgi:predicted pyridoxine 5'-phosphate oxidase superfamily flavin-nucleotide-binding protein
MDSEDKANPLDVPNRFQDQFGRPASHVLEKADNHLDDWLRRFIGHSPFLVMSTVSHDGLCCGSPRGGARGFVRILNERTLLIPDYPGNNLFQSNANLDRGSSIALLFLIPGFSETARVVGTARIAPHEEFVERGAAVAGERVRQWIVVKVHHAYYHCGRAIRAANLWDVEAILEARDTPPLTKRPERKRSTP